MPTNRDASCWLPPQGLVWANVASATAADGGGEHHDGGGRIGGTATVDTYPSRGSPQAAPPKTPLDPTTPAAAAPTLQVEDVCSGPRDGDGEFALCGDTVGGAVAGVCKDFSQGACSGTEDDDDASTDAGGDSGSDAGPVTPPPERLAFTRARAAEGDAFRGSTAHCSFFCRELRKVSLIGTKRASTRSSDF